MNFPLSWRNGRLARGRDLPPAPLPPSSLWSLWPSSTSVAIGAGDRGIFSSTSVAIGAFGGDVCGMGIGVVACRLGEALGGAFGAVFGAAHLGVAFGPAHLSGVGHVAHFPFGCSVGAATAGGFRVGAAASLSKLSAMSASKAMSSREGCRPRGQKRLE